MKIFYNTIVCLLIVSISFSQNNNKAEKDTLKEKTVKLEKVIVLGDPKTDPIHSVVSNKYEDKVVQPKNVADLFNGINGFSVIKRGNYANDPSFRASQYEQLNIQYDGGTKAMHACPNRMDPITTHIIPEEISKIEIVKGPFTVRYGANFGGIINLVTHTPDESDYGLHGKVSGGYETNGSSYVSMVQLQKATEKYDIAGNFGYRDFGNYEDGNSIEIPSSFRSTDYGLKAGLNISKNQRLQAHWRQSFGRDVKHAGLPMDTDFDNSSILSVDYKLDNIGEKVKYLSAKAYYSYVDHLMTNTNRPSFMMTDAASNVEATTFGGKIELKWQPSTALQVYSGLDLINISRDGTRVRLIKIMNGNPLPMPMEKTDKIWQDSEISDIGIFSELKWFANNSTIFTGGLRYDLVSSNINDPETDFAQMYELEKRTEHNISGTLSVKKIVSPNFTLEAAYGRGVRSANMIERYINHFTIGQDPYEYIGNPDLKAEINNQFEIGMRGRSELDGFFNSVSVSSSFYYSYFENYIVGIIDESLTRKYMPMLEPRHPKVFQNLDKAYKTGFEFGLNFDFLEDFYLKTELAYVYTKNKDLNESLPLNPPFNTSISLGLDKEKYWLNAKLNLVSKQDHIAKSFGETYTKGYETFDVRLGVKPIKNVTLGVAALNIFDKNYTNHLNFSFKNQSDFGAVPITEPGRNLTAFLQYKF